VKLTCMSRQLDADPLEAFVASQRVPFYAETVGRHGLLPGTHFPAAAVRLPHGPRRGAWRRLALPATGSVDDLGAIASASRQCRRARHSGGVS
jgi:hypothetical protein